MASSIYLRAELTGNAEAKIQQIDALAKKLSSTPITIKVNAQSVNGLSKEMMSLANNQARAQVTANQLAIAQEKTRQAVEKTRQSVEKTAQAQEKTTQAVEKTAQTQNRLAIETQKTDRSFAQMNATAQSTESLLDSIAAKFTFANLASIAIYKLTSAFQDSLTTLKEVDSQLVNIQKVTDMTDREMAGLSERAYDTASNMGRTATEVLNSSVEFARAGYGDQIEELSELSILLQNIGDVSNETANKFILAADAAWGLGENSEKIMPILDGLNEITNRNATDMDKLASGVTVAASVFAEADESIETFAAMLGTTTAATQRSGEEMARGLRTILMNIRQIKGETEDGELIDGESIANASKALKQYANISTMANGELRKSSDVLEELAGKWDTLDSVAQSAIGEALAGKRQANVLTALMSNWDMYEKMLTDYAEGAGSALRENEIYLESWEAKSKVLSSTWTEFVSHLVDTGAIKTSLSGITGLIEALDTDFGRAAITVGALSAAVVLLSKSFTKLNESIFQNPLFAKTAAISAAIIGLVTVIDALTTSYEEHIEKIDELSTQYDETTSEIDKLTAKIEENNAVISGTEPLADGQSVEFLKQQNKALEDQLVILRERQQLLNEQKNEEVKGAFDSQRYFNNQLAGENLSSSLEEQQNFNSQWNEYLNNPGAYSQSEAESLIAQKNQYQQNVDANRNSLESGYGIEEYVDALIAKIKELNDTPYLSQEQEEQLRSLKEELVTVGEDVTQLKNNYTGQDSFSETLGNIASNISEALGTVSEETQNASEAAEEAGVSIAELSNAVETLKSQIENLQSAYSTLTNAVNEYNSSGYISIDTFQQLIELGPEYYSLLVNENGQLVLNTEAYQQLTAAKIENMAISQSLEVVQ